MMRVLDRAVKWLMECQYLKEMWHGTARGKLLVYFRRVGKAERISARPRVALPQTVGATRTEEPAAVDSLKLWLAEQRADDLAAAEERCIASRFGSELERSIVQDEKSRGVAVLHGGRIRQEYLRRFLEHESPSQRPVAAAV